MFDNVIPLFTPLLALLKSRKFWLAVFGIVFDVVVVFNPNLEGMREEVIMAATAIIVFLMGFIAWEDAAQKSAGG